MATVKKQELVSRVYNLLREYGYKKAVRVPRYDLHISDDDGNTATFHIKQADKEYQYVSEDVARIIDVFIDVVVDAMKRGEKVSVYGLGRFSPKLRKETRCKHPETGEYCIVPAHHYLKFEPSDALKTAVKMFDMSIKDGYYTAVDDDDDEQDDDYAAEG